MVSMRNQVLATFGLILIFALLGGCPKPPVSTEPPAPIPNSISAFNSQICQLVEQAAALRQKVAEAHGPPTPDMISRGGQLVERSKHLRDHVPGDHPRAFDIQESLDLLSEYGVDDFRARETFIEFAADANSLRSLGSCGP